MGQPGVESVAVIGAGLAGSECAYQLARLGVAVVLHEMKPQRRSAAHKSDDCAELVCSNSFRSDNVHSAIGLLHAELRDLDSLVLGCADEFRVPAGDALAVDREKFSARVTERLLGCREIELRRGEVTKLPTGLVVVATGPLTSDALTRELATHVGEKMYFYDAIAPIVSAESIDRSVAFAQSRYGKGDGDDYLNLPMTKDDYLGFVQLLRAGKKVTPHEFEEPKYFEGCLPIEVLAERGDAALAFGPMKPVGLRDPRTGQRPHAVVQLRKEDLAASAYNMVGFQTRLTWPEQQRIFRHIPGLERAEFLRLGQIHRNTFIDAPRLLGEDLALRNEPRLYFAGQVCGVEGYVESAACGYLVALAVAARLGRLSWSAPPATTALGALYRHVTGKAHPENYAYQPSNVIFALFPPLPGRLGKQQRRVRLAERGREDFSKWLAKLPQLQSPRALDVPSEAQQRVGS